MFAVDNPIIWIIGGAVVIGMLAAVGHSIVNHDRDVMRIKPRREWADDGER